ncbi:MAG: mobile mystery protein A [Cyclobacteriaceae bacterium]
MKKLNQKLIIEQMDKKMAFFKKVIQIEPPAKGWIQAIRVALKMSLRQFGERMNITSPSVRELEQREALGTISLKSMREAAQALDMKFVYGFVPKEESLAVMVDKQALRVARKIVMRTDNTMKLEDQRVSKERVEKAVRELADEIKREMPRYLWD